MASSGAETSAEGIMKGLGADLRLHREAALQKLECHLQRLDAADRQTFLAGICSGVLLLIDADSWQQRLGGFAAAKVLLQAGLCVGCWGKLCIIFRIATIEVLPLLSLFRAGHCP